ncbi:hypothetical protein [Collinsella tanakaei]|uniref:hypothetical protein n=1 Tax=Collinsella tanakaei TaxID=626935 RepID=UPI001957851E|nr:hypothetical protein [Collinsella tanakaei]MBM6867276.1 hypothetical protein [Collinsella tanakaei]
MTQTTTSQARTVTTSDHGKLDIKALVLLAVLLAAGFILNMFLGKAIGAMSAGMINPEFIISAFCLTILVVRPNAIQALIIGLISAAVIQLTTSLPGADFVAEGVAAVLMALIVNAGMKTSARAIIPTLGTFVTTFVSGFIFMVIRMVLMQFDMAIAAAMLPVVAITAVFNAVLVGALYVPIKKALKLND